MLLTRPRAILSELYLGFRLRLLRRRERSALISLGAAAASAPIASAPAATVRAQIADANRKLERLKTEIAASMEADRVDYAGVSPWVRPVVIVRGLCARAILRNRITSIQRNLAALHQALGEALVQSSSGIAQTVAEPTRAVLQVRADLDPLLAERARRLAPFGGTALPHWLPRLGSEANRLGHAVWLQLRPNVLPRLPALAGLAVGWWIADTYTTSHVKSLLHSVGIGNGGRRVVSGETYRAMLFWLPILSAGVCAYLAEWARLLVQRRYQAPVPDR